MQIVNCQLTPVFCQFTVGTLQLIFDLMEVVNMWSILAGVATICLAPIWMPLALYIALTFSWEDTVPSLEERS